MKFVDITHGIHRGMPHFNAAWHCAAEISQMGYVRTVGRNTSRLVFGSHCGTHVDAPRHFIDDGDAIDQIDVATLIGPVEVVDLSDVERDASVSLERVSRIPLAERMIFHFNWAEVWERGDFYSGYPFFSDAAVDYIVSSGKVRLLGMDTPSPDDSRIALGSPEDSKAHKAFLAAGIVLVEYLDTSGLKEFGPWNMAALPLKIEGCDGSPARVVLYR